jgi:hypothetical protein
MTPAGSPPPLRWGHSLGYDPKRNRVLLLGGIGIASSADVWALELSPEPRWTRLIPEGVGPPQAPGPTLTWDASGERFLVMTGAGFYALELEPALRWERIDASGDMPLTRDDAAAAVDETSNRYFLFGGLDQSPDSWFFTAREPAIPVQIDFRHPINPNSHGRFGATVLGQPFDVTSIDVTTVRLADAPAIVVPGHRHHDDINRDGWVDLRLQFDLDDMVLPLPSSTIETGTIFLELVGETHDLDRIRGGAAARVVGPDATLPLTAGENQRLEFRLLSSRGRFGDGLSLAVETPHGGPIEVDLFDLHGRRATSVTRELTVGRETMTVPGASALPRGVYFLRARMHDETRVSRIVIL